MTYKEYLKKNFLSNIKKVVILVITNIIKMDIGFILIL